MDEGQARAAAGGPVGRPGPGRPRDGQADAAILDAARQLLEAGGYAELTFARIAERAEVGKGTVYRRWPSKGFLVVALLKQAIVAGPAVDTGSLAGDLRAFLKGMVKALRTPLARRTLPGLAAEILDDPELAAAFREHMLEVTRCRVATALELAARRGEPRATIDPLLLGELLLGPVYWRMLLSGRPLDARFVDGVVEHAVAGLRARGRGGC